MKAALRAVWLLLLVGWLAGPSSVCAVEPTLQDALEQTVLAEGQPLREVKAFIAARLIAPPECSDLDAWQGRAERLRGDVLDRIVFRGAAARWRDAECGVEWLDAIPGGPGYTIRKFRYEALPGMWIPGLLYQPEKLEGRVPLVLNVNGHDPAGKAADYKQLRAINQAKRGMLALNVEWFGMGQLRSDGFSHGRMNQLELCGAGGLAPFYLAMSQALDVGLALEHADPKRVAVAGLSGGGWQTIVISSLDERVTLANPVAGYGSFHTNLAYGDMGDSEQAPTDLATLADYTHLTALRAPRPTLLTYNAQDDCCFQSGHTLEPLLAAARPIFALYGAEDRLRSHVNHDPGTHNFEQDNRQQLYAMLGDFFYAGDNRFVREEIESTSELKTPEELHVPLPEANVDLHRLAVSLAKALPDAGRVERATPRDVAQQEQLRKRLRALLRVPDYGAAVPGAGHRMDGRWPANAMTLRVGDTWTVPATLLTPTTKAANGGVIVIADEGRATQAAEARRLLEAGYYVDAADLLLWGESQLKGQDPDYTYPLMMAAAGERALGVQAGQLISLARWTAKQPYPRRPARVLAVGPRASAVALVAAALEPQAIAGVEAVDGLTSFRELINRDVPVEKMPELFAFGLLAECDVPQLVALCAPGSVTFRKRDAATD
ncbi:MAG: hypothetical protein DWQ37_17325 [Planctomycetota bacterium]|nr:MAG: hypothetical protein DWQ37_17325 [Planctomycetota bacterium]